MSNRHYKFNADRPLSLSELANDISDWARRGVHGIEFCANEYGQGPIHGWVLLHNVLVLVDHDGGDLCFAEPGCHTKMADGSWCDAVPTCDQGTCEAHCSVHGPVVYSMLDSRNPCHIADECKQSENCEGKKLYCRNLTEGK